MPLQFKHLLGACSVCLFRGRPRGKSGGLLFNADYSLKDVENAWYAFHLGLFVVPFFFKALLLKTCCLVLPGEKHGPGRAVGPLQGLGTGMQP